MQVRNLSFLGRQSLRWPYRRQQGVTAIGLLVLAILLAFWVLIIVKLLPVYMEARSVRSVFDRYQEEYAQVGTDKRKIIGYFERFFQVNAVYDVDPKDIKLDTDKKNLIVTLDYEVRVPFITGTSYGDLWVLIAFSNKAVVPRGAGDGE